LYSLFGLKKDYKLLLKRNWDVQLLRKVVMLLVNHEPLPYKCRDHKLQGMYADCRECHIKSDWLLIYTIDREANVLELVASGSHSDLF
jgi:mRNA interferase YafQ